MKFILPFLLISVILLSSCDPFNRDYKFEYDIIISDIPSNLEKLNTEYDDYNSDLPYPYSFLNIYFSSNRNSNGDDYDIVFKSIDISYHEKDNILNFSVPSTDWINSFRDKLFPLINTQSDEYGPYSFSGPHGWDYFFYANNETGDFDIKFVYTKRLDWGTYEAQERLYGPQNLALVNSDYDDLYPTINQNTSKLLFCSNRENNQFDIFNADINTENFLPEYLFTTNSIPISKVEVLSSTSNDKCPSITNNLLVFASDRDGGYGGYDLYYSLYADKKWSEPVNFGDKINSEDDEYRPITFTFNKFDIMIYSSNRPGGKGGYDLYSVIIEDLIK
ncbi:MAG: hypothetical protein U9N72_03435 [Bacteroidota bacterium]|nr:hypothetical protein [Bacteroidota bacterium]